MKNPYWQDKYKAHVIDRGEIQSLCFEIDSIILASASRQGEGLDSDEEVSTEFPMIDGLFHSIVEAELSKRLLRLALLVRSFDDNMKRANGTSYTEYRAETEKGATLGAVYTGTDKIEESIRECCNKIIHAEDVRPVYTSEDDRHDEKAKWGMTGELELEGTKGGEEWTVSVSLRDFLDSVLYLIEYEA